MNSTLKKIFFIVTYNSCLFIMLIIGIQNSSKKSSLNLLINRTINLPISFIIGTSFLAGSALGGIISLNLQEKQN